MDYSQQQQQFQQYQLPEYQQGQLQLQPQQLQEAQYQPLGQQELPQQHGISNAPDNTDFSSRLPQQQQTYADYSSLPDLYDTYVFEVHTGAQKGKRLLNPLAPKNRCPLVSLMDVYGVRSPFFPLIATPGSERSTFKKAKYDVFFLVVCESIL